ncbi:hypothetical protein FACS1894108_11580 [Planctomycetales bacterium]|nr:hypothetical protein FACS1894108_11580 [Planctomycetales bacterium]
MKRPSLFYHWLLTGGLFCASVAPAWADAADENFQYAIVLMSDREEFAAAAEKFHDYAVAHPADANAPAAWFYLANCYAKLKKEQTAAETYEKLVRLYPADPLAGKALAYGADAYFRAALYPQAIELYGEISRRYPQSEWAATAPYWRAEGYARLLTAAGDADNDETAAWFAAAQTDFSTFLKQPHPFRADALYSAGLLAFARRDYPLAAERLAQLTREFADYPRREDALYHLAESYYWQNDYARADQIFAALAAEFSTGKYRAETASGRGWCAYMRQDADAAAKFFAQAATEFTDADKSGQARFDAGAAYEEAGADAAALAEFAAVPENHPQRGAALLRQGVIVRKQANDLGNLAAAEKFFAEAARVGGDTAGEAAAFLGEIRLKQQNFTGAAEALQTALTRDGGGKFAPFARYHLALALSHLRQYDAAVRALEILQKDFPSNQFRLPAEQLLAECEKERGNAPAALAAWQRLASIADTSIADTSVAAANGVSAENAEWAARALFNLGEMTGDATWFAQLVEKYPTASNVAAAQIRLGEAAEKKADYAVALAAYDAALIAAQKISPSSGDTRSGDTRSGDTRSGDARSGDTEALIRHAEYRLAVLGVLAANQQTGDKNTAMRDAQMRLSAFREKYQASEVQTPVNRALYYVAEAEYATGNKSDAARDYLTCYQNAPADALADAALFGLAWVKNELGDSETAAATWQKLLKEFPRSEYRGETLYLLTTTRAARGDYAAAREWLKQLQALEGDSPRVAIERAKITEALGDRATAKQILAPFIEAPVNQPERARALNLLSWVIWRDVEPMWQASVARENNLKKFLAGKKLRELPDDRKETATAMRDEWLAARNAAWVLENNLVGVLEKLTTDYPDFSGRAAASLRLGEILYERGDYARATDYYRQVLSGEEELRDKAFYRLGWCALRLSEKNPAERRFLRQTALENFRRVCAQYAPSPLAGESAWQAAEILRGDGDFTAAMPLYQAVAALPAGAEIKSGALYEYADCLLELKKYGDAFTAFKEFLARPAAADEKLWLPEAHWGAGYAALKLGAYQDARQYFLAAKDNNYGGEAAAKARYGLGVIEFEQGNYKVAREEFRKVEAFHPGWTEISALALLKAADASQKLGELDHAKKDLERLLQRYTDTAAATQARELLSARGGDDKEQLTIHN